MTSVLTPERCDIRGCCGVCKFHVRQPDKSRIDLCEWHIALAQGGCTIEPCDRFGEVMPQGEEYVCTQCGGTFEKGWSDEEAQAEADEVFGAPIDEPVVVCDDCYQKIQEWGQRTGELDTERDRLARLTAGGVGVGGDDTPRCGTDRVAT